MLNVFVQGWKLEYSALSESCLQEIDVKALSTDASATSGPQWQLLATSGPQWQLFHFHSVQVFSAISVPGMYQEDDVKVPVSSVMI